MRSYHFFFLLASLTIVQDALWGFFYLLLFKQKKKNTPGYRKLKTNKEGTKPSILPVCLAIKDLPSPPPSTHQAEKTQAWSCFPS